MKNIVCFKRIVFAIACFAVAPTFDCSAMEEKATHVRKKTSLGGEWTSFFSRLKRDAVNASTAGIQRVKKLFWGEEKSHGGVGLPLKVVSTLAKGAVLDYFLKPIRASKLVYKYCIEDDDGTYRLRCSYNDGDGDGGWTEYPQKGLTHEECVATQCPNYDASEALNTVLQVGTLLGVCVVIVGGSVCWIINEKDKLNKKDMEKFIRDTLAENGENSGDEDSSEYFSSASEPNESEV